jgi:archaemetzincin
MNLYLAPVKFSNISLLDKIKKGLEEIFLTQVKIVNINLDVESAFSAERKQYYSTQLISLALPHTEEYNGKIILLTEYDLYVPVLTFIFGEAQLRGKHCIVSICRLHEEFYSGISDDELLYKRTMKEILHELGHTFGLIHCLDWDCVMHASLEIEEIDIKGNLYCKNCSKKTVVFEANKTIEHR